MALSAHGSHRVAPPLPAAVPLHSRAFRRPLLQELALGFAPYVLVFLAVVIAGQ